MIKRLLIFMLIFTLSTTVVCGDAYAQPKVDVANFVSKAKQWISQAAKKAQKIAEKVKKAVQDKIMGSVAEANKYKANAIAKVEGATGIKLADAHKYKAMAEEGKADAAKSKEEFDKKAAVVLKIKALEAQKKEINSKYDQEIEVIEEKYKTWFASNDLESLMATDSNDEDRIKAAQEDRKQLVADKNEELAAEKKRRDSEVLAINLELATFVAETTANSQIANDLFDKMSKKEETPTVADLDKQFFAEKESIESQVIVRDMRAQLATSDLVDLLDTSLKISSQVPVAQEKIEELDTGVKTVEYSPSINISVEMDIEIMRNMIKNIKLKNARLRRQTTQELAKSADVKSNPGTVDIQTFDIEDYSYARNCKNKGGNLFNKAQGFAKKITGEGIGGVNLNDIKKTKEEMSNAKI